MLRHASVPGDCAFITWAHEDLAAYARHAYTPADNTFAIMVTDGTRLSPSDVKRKGYYKKSSFTPFPAGPLFLLGYARAFRLTRDPDMWKMARSITEGNGFGDIGETPGGGPTLNMGTLSSDPVALFGILELHRTTGQPELLALAGVIGDNIIRSRFHHGFFGPDEENRFTKFDSLEPLALLHLEASRVGRAGEMPRHYAGRSYFHCRHEGRGRTYDSFIYSLKRPKAAE